MLLGHRWVDRHNGDMGTLTYDSTLAADFDDRTLVHIQFIIGAKLRRNEPFFFTWKDDSSIGDGRSTIWVHPAVSLTFKYFGSRVPAINLKWIDVLMLSANSTAGMQLVPEPTADGAPLASHRQGD